MVKDYHMHPALLCTSEERFDAFVRRAIECGIGEICITDHMPLIGLFTADRIPEGKIREYCRSIRAMSEKYRDAISIRLGIEIDYYPTVCDQIEKILKEGDFDYVIGSSHLHAIDHGALLKGMSGRNELASAMFENTVSAARSGYFNTIAHLDMFHAIFAKPTRYPIPDDGYSDEKHIEEIDRTLDAIKAAGLRLEINPHLASPEKDLGKVYPSERILRMALEKGMKFAYGSDAHKPEDVGSLLNELRAHPLYGRAIADWEKESITSKERHG